MKWVYIGGTLLIVAALAFLYFFNRPGQLEKNGQLTSGTVTSVKFNLRNYPVFSYVFKVKGKRYEDKKEGLNIYTEANSLLIHRSFPVIYEPANPNKNELLVSPDDFKKFNMPYPDSLNDIKAYLMQ